jgi:RHS repeat-associated protein
MSSDQQTSGSAKTASQSPASAAPRPAIEIPKGGESSGFGEAFGQVGPTGSLDWSMQVPLTPARGVEPELSLAYAQSNGNGPFGYGFGISVPFFSRRTDKGIPRYQGDDSFDGPGGNLVPAYQEKGDRWTLERRTAVLESASYRVTRYRPRVEAAFDRIEFWEAEQSGDSFWRVTDSYNTISEYGRSPAARVADPEKPARIFQWLLESTVDVHGNKSRFHYKLENQENVPAVLYERGHGPDCQRYLSKIEYGNWIEPLGGQERFALQVLFDYGEYDVDSGSAFPVREWAYRPDPFSSFRAGFEVRTKRRCAGVLMVHQFPSLQEGKPVLVHALRFDYMLNAGLSQIVRITGQGFRHQVDGSFQTISQAPTEFTYWGLDLSASQQGALEVGTGQADGILYSFVDLFGDGLPGVLAPAADALRYSRSAGPLRFEPEVVLPEMPSEHVPESQVMLMDLAGENRLDMVVFGLNAAGSYKNNQDGTWQPFREFETTSTLAAFSGVQMVDLSGAGRTDLALFTNQDVVTSLSLATKGFEKPFTEVLPSQFPVSPAPDERKLETFANMFGDGLQHRVKISSGSVEVWPSLGYGSFAEKISIANAPQFRPTLRPDRILLTGMAGTGCADMVLVYGTVAELYPNQNGNQFLDPILIPLPCPVDNMDVVTAADLFGTGRPALIVSQTGSPAQNYFAQVGSRQPVLGLRSMDNNRGQHQSVWYRPAADYAAADRAAGTPWSTRLPVAVQVVERIVTEDAVNGSTVTSAFQYRDGYWDPSEHSFTCFGSVQRQDSETFDPQTWRFPTAVAAAMVPSALSSVEPQLVRMWSFTGQPVDPAKSDEERFYFQGDPEAIRLPAIGFSDEIEQAGGVAVREAYYALSGSLIRRETYGIGGSGKPGEVPYLVEQNGSYVRMLQPPLEGNPAVFHISDRETASSTYDQMADDPRIEHSVVIQEDAFGHPEQTATIFYPRRSKPNRTILPGQDTLRVTCAVTGWINVEKPFYRLGVAYREQTFEVGNPTLTGRYYTFAEITGVIHDALLHPIPFGQPFSPSGLEVRLFEASRTFFWNEQGTAVLPLGQLSRPVLVHHSEEAVFPEKYPDQVYAGRVTTSMLAQESRFHPDEGYWWTTGAVTRYGGTELFYQPATYTEPFQIGTNFTTVTQYDPYALAPVKVIDALNHSVSAVLDYQTLKPVSVTDPNGTIAEVQFDPLGRVLVSAVHGHMAGAYAGSMDLAHYKQRPRPKNIFEVISDPVHYIQGAAIYFFYRDDAWTARHQPVHYLTLVCDQFVNDPAGITTKEHVRMAVVYLDGGGETACNKTAVESDYTPDPVQKPADDAPPQDLIWITGSQAELDARGNPVRRYLQYFSATPDFERPQTVPYFAFNYDALDRVVRTLLPNASHTRNTYTPWSLVYFDENDCTPGRFDFDTPETTWFDNRGLAIQRTRINAVKDQNDREEMSEFTVLDIAGNTLAQTDARFYNPQDPLHPVRWNLQHVYDMLGHSLVVESVDAGNAVPGKTYWLFTSAGDLACNWDARGFSTVTNYQAPIRRVANVVVSRDGASTMRLRLEYGDSAASNNINMTVKTMDEAGVSTAPSFDLLGNALAIHRRYASEYKRSIDWSDPAKVGLEPATWTMEMRHNAVGEPVEQVLADKTGLLYHRYKNGALRSVETSFPGEPPRTSVSLQYDANGQRRRIALENSVATEVAYTPDLMRIESIQSARGGDQAVLLRRTYAYDPVGNVTGVVNPLERPRAVRGQLVSADFNYQYDAIYRLQQATGRCQPGNTPSSCASSMPGSHRAVPVNDAQQIENYTRQYTYDCGGNLTRLRHAAQSGTWNWELAVSKTSNHSVPASMVPPGGSPDQFFDPSGNLMSLETIAGMEYSDRNLLRKAVIISRPEQMDDAEYYVYDAGGIRVRKVTERLIAGGNAWQRTDTLYIGDAAIVLVTKKAVVPPEENSTPLETMIRQTNQVQIMADNLRVLVSSIESGGPPASRVYLYQLTDAQNSVCVETDAAGAVTGYQEYFPFGCVSVQGGTWATDTSAPRYRFTGFEQDTATGFYVAELRYYVPWLYRWLTVDPSGPVDSLNLYQYSDNNPVTLTDPSGLNPDDALLLYHHLRYMKVAEFDKAVDVANAVFNEAYQKKALFTDESARFSPALEKRIVGLFGEYIGAFSAANASLREALSQGGASAGGGATGSDYRKQYQTLRTRVNKTLPAEFPHFDFSPESGQRPFELHHLHYKAQAPSLAITETNFAMATRGSSSSGLIGTHEGLFHLVTSGNDSSIYTREIAGVIGVIKRMIASYEGIDLDKTPKPTGAYSWLGFKKGAPYSKPGTGKTKETRAKSFRIQRQQALKREKKHLPPKAIRFKPSASKSFRKKIQDEGRARKLGLARLRVVKINLHV